MIEYNVTEALQNLSRHNVLHALSLSLSLFVILSPALSVVVPLRHFF